MSYGNNNCFSLSSCCSYRTHFNVLYRSKKIRRRQRRLSFKKRNRLLLCKCFIYQSSIFCVICIWLILSWDRSFRKRSPWLSRSQTSYVSIIRSSTHILMEFLNHPPDSYFHLLNTKQLLNIRIVSESSCSLILCT